MHVVFKASLASFAPQAFGFLASSKKLMFLEFVAKFAQSFLQPLSHK